MRQYDLNLRVNLLFLCAIIILVWSFSPSVYLDLYRYYEYAKSISIKANIGDYVKYTYESSFDFIYYLGFYLCRYCGVSYKFLTVFFVSFYYIQLLYFYYLYQKKFNFQVHKYNLLLITISSLMASEPILVFSISRNIAAMAILTWGINNFIKKKYKVAGLSVALSLFTHVGSFVYVFIAALPVPVFYFCRRKVQISYLYRRVILVFISTLPILFASQLISFARSIIICVLGSILPVRYVESYLDISNDYSNNIIVALGSPISAIPIVFSHFLVFCGLFFSKRWNLALFLCFSFYFSSLLAMFSIPFISQRLNFVFPIIQFILAINLMTDVGVSRKIRSFYLILMFCCVALWFFDLYLYRNLFI